MELQPVKVQDCLLDKKNKKNIVDKYDSGNYGLSWNGVPSFIMTIKDNEQH